MYLRAKKKRGGGEGHGPIVSQRVERQEPGPQEGPPRLSTPEVCKKPKMGPPIDLTWKYLIQGGSV